MLKQPWFSHTKYSLQGSQQVKEKGRGYSSDIKWRDKTRIRHTRQLNHPIKYSNTLPAVYPREPWHNWAENFHKPFTSHKAQRNEDEKDIIYLEIRDWQILWESKTSRVLKAPSNFWGTSLECGGSRRGDGCPLILLSWTGSSACVYTFMRTLFDKNVPLPMKDKYIKKCNHNRFAFCKVDITA